MAQATASRRDAGDAASGHGGARWFVTLALTGLCLLLRGTHLMALPIFGDESIYLRWAQAIRDHPWPHLFVSLIDPKPPLHFWLLAIFWKLTGNPLESGRWVSVFAAAATVPAVIFFWRACAAFYRQFDASAARRNAPLHAAPPDAQAVAYIAAIAFIFCPYLAFYQRMALADPIFILEMVLVAWLSVRLAAAAVALGTTPEVLPRGTPLVMDAPAPAPVAALPAASPVGLAGGCWRYGLPLGIAMGAAVMTRQNISYVLWGLAPAAYACLWNRRLNLRRSAAALLAWLAVAAVVAGALWCPYLFAHGPFSLKTRILYRSSFVGGLSLSQRLGIILHNAREAFLPLRSQVVHGTATLGFSWQAGWLWTYLTPPVEVLSLLSIIYVAWRRQWRLLVFLLFWWGITLGPVIVFGKVAYARYALSGAVPLLCMLAWALTDAISLLYTIGLPEWAAGVLALGALAAVFAWPMQAILLQQNHWSRQELVPLDRHQYVTGWTGGAATQAAIHFIRSLPRTGLTVITSNGWGTPADGLWAFLHGRKHIHMYYSNSGGRRALLRAVPGKPGSFYLRKHKYLYTPPQAVAIRPGEPILYVSPDPIYVANAAVPSGRFLRKANPQLQKLAHFYNPPHRNGRPAAGTVVIYRVRRPAQAPLPVRKAP